MSNEINIITWIIVIAFYFFTLFFINSIIQLISIMAGKNEEYKNTYKYQKHFYNYTLATISVIAILLTVLPGRYLEEHVSILVIAAISVFCTLISHLYNIIYISNNKVENSYNRITSAKKEWLSKISSK